MGALVKPETLQDIAYEKELRRMEFFRYHVNEALALTDRERQDCVVLLKRQYLPGNGGKYAHIVSRLEHLLDEYYKAGEQYEKGLPTVLLCVDNLCVSPNYLDD